MCHFSVPFIFLSNVYISLFVRGMLDINTGHCIMERKTVHENLARNQRERDRQLRELKKVELQLKQAQDALVYTQLLHDKTKSTVSSQFTH